MDNTKATPHPGRLSRTASRESDVSSGRRVSFASEAEVKKTGRRTSVPLKPFDESTPRSYTPETFSDASSAKSGDSGFYEVIEYDPSAQIMSFNLNQKPAATAAPATPPRNAKVWDAAEGEEELTEEDIPFEIGDNTPAAEALRAAAAVKVSRVGKAARAVHMQAVRRLVKRATLTGKQGVVKGQPERLPPRQLQEGEVHPDELSDLEEEDEDSSHSDDHHDPLEAHNELSSHHYDGEPVVPDDVVQGTAEAGKKCKCTCECISFS